MFSSFPFGFLPTFFLLVTPFVSSAGAVASVVLASLALVEGFETCSVFFLASFAGAGVFAAGAYLGESSLTGARVCEAGASFGLTSLVGTGLLVGLFLIIRFFLITVFTSAFAVSGTFSGESRVVILYISVAGY